MPAADEWTAIGTGAGVVVTAVGAALVWWQISAASSALYGTNSYAVHKDIIDAYDHVLDAEDQIDQKTGQDSALKATLKRQIIRLDSLIETADGLHNNKGLSDDSWKHVLSSICPGFEKDKYKIKETDIPAVQSACENGKPLWKAQVR